MPVFAKHESLYRAILRATDADPGRRFASMDELADQLTGVLHEIAAADSGQPEAAALDSLQPAARHLRGGLGRAAVDGSR